MSYEKRLIVRLCTRKHQECSRAAGGILVCLGRPDRYAGWSAGDRGNDLFEVVLFIEQRGDLSIDVLEFCA